MKTSLIWFTNNLRVQDNKPLYEACKNENVIACYCFDPRHYAKTAFGFEKTSKFRTKFLIESVANLEQNLKGLNIKLLVSDKKPEDFIPAIVSEFDVDAIYYQKEWTSEEEKVENNVCDSIPSAIGMIPFYDQFLFEPSDIPYNVDSIPKVFTEFRKKCEQQVKVRKPLSIPEQKKINNYTCTSTIQSKIPNLDHFGFTDFDVDSRSAFPFKGGEEAALERIEDYFFTSQNLQNYKQTRNGLIGSDYSSKFSAWLANGSISAKTIYSKVRSFEEKVIKNEDTYWLIFELIWRDFFKYISLKHGNKIFKIGGILSKEYEWKKDKKVIENWINGKTKYDFVNANMIEIAKTGFMSNRGRQNVASYFAKEMQQDWRIGASYFESMLLDYDVHSNWGNWIYNAGVGNDPRDRIFNIKSQAERYDGDNEYVNLWL